MEVSPNFLISKLRKLNSIFFIIQHFVHNKYKLFTATVKKTCLHRGAPSKPDPVHCDAGLHDLEGGALCKKEAYFYNFVFLKIKLAALPKNILKYNKKFQITL